MIIIGADYHSSFQQIAFVDSETGELQERRLEHPEAAEKFYCELAAQGMKVRVGMEASGHARWFERLLAELNFELWIAHQYSRPTAQHVPQVGKREGGYHSLPRIWAVRRRRHGPLHRQLLALS